MMSIRKRQISALQAETFMCSNACPRSAEIQVVLAKPQFHLDLWLSFTMQNWILDVGGSVVMCILLADWFPLSLPGAAEYLHLLFNVTAPLTLLKILERSPWTLPGPAVHLCIITIVTGTSFRLVTDSVTRQLLQFGYQLHLSIRENPVMKDIEPLTLVDAFELLFYYNSIGHLIWYIPLFLSLLLFFSGCFCHRKQEERMSTAAWMLLAPNAVYYWYLITEGQTFILFIFTFFTMVATVMSKRRWGMVPDSNGLFMLYSFSAALVLVAFWVFCLWNNSVLRRKHPGLIYIPQPRAVYTLHLQQNKHNVVEPLI